VGGESGLDEVFGIAEWAGINEVVIAEKIGEG
jgi:hypothetical protein